MVRLKAKCLNDTTKVNKVSIPYGSIKSIIILRKLFTVITVSIPYGSIKSKKLSTSPRAYTAFQFLMVRLKAIMLSSKRGGYQFQFLMVRLKVARVSALQGHPAVSIPYGSIKRDISIASSIMESIVSIPYGSIKSYSSTNHWTICFVSIPYGSIKSFSRLSVLRTAHEFQFLMVRLKVGWYLSCCIALFCFNSLWFD